MEDFHAEVCNALGEKSKLPAFERCAHYRYYRPGDPRCPFDEEPQASFWACEQWFHLAYAKYSPCDSDGALWSFWEAYDDWAGPEQFRGHSVSTRLLAFFVMNEYLERFPDSEFPLEEYFSLADRGGRPCQDLPGEQRNHGLVCPSARGPATA